MNKSAAQRWVIVYPTTPMFLRVRCNEKPRPDGVPMSLPGTFRTWRDVRLESAMRFKADIAVEPDPFSRERLLDPLDRRMLPVLDLDPVRRAAGAVGAVTALRNQALQTEVAGSASTAWLNRTWKVLEAGSARRLFLLRRFWSRSILPIVDRAARVLS
jgi:hypothetical protein